MVSARGQWASPPWGPPWCLPGELRATEGRGAEGLRELMAGGLPPGLGWGLQWCQEEGAGYGVGSWLLPLGLGTLGTGEGGPSCPLRGLGVVVLEAET